MPRTNIRGADIAYDDSGDTTRPAIVLLHSVGLSTREGWRAQTPELAARYRVVSFDFRGLGQSAKGDAPLGVDTFVADLAALLDNLGIEEATLMGVSLGGFVAQAFAVNYPQRTGALVLVSAACAIPGGNSGARAERNRRIREHGMAAAAGPQIDSHFPADFRAQNPGLMQWYRDHYIANDPASYTAIMEDLGRFDYCDRIPAIACPTLIVAGGADSSSVAGAKPGDSARKMAEKIPGARLEIIAGAHHYPQIDHEKEFNRVVFDFLENTGRNEQ